MLTIWIHLDTGDIRKANVPEDYSSGDLLADVLRSVHPGSPRMEWGFYDGTPEKVLSSAKTLAQNDVSHDAHLHLFSRMHLALEIDAPGHAAVRREYPQNTLTGALLAELVRHFQLPGLPGDWQLVHSGSPDGLDLGKTLAANGVHTGEWLSLQPKQKAASHEQILTFPPRQRDITLSMKEPKTGKKAIRTLSGSTVLSALLADVVETLQLPTKTRTGAAQVWIFERDRAAGGSQESLDLDETLENNGLKDGSVVELKASVEEPELVLTMIAPGGAVRTVEAEPALGTEHLLRMALKVFALPEAPKRYRLQDKNRHNKVLDLTQTLGQNGVADGASLQLVPRVFPWMMLGYAALGALLLGVLSWVTFRRPITVELTSSRTALTAAQTAQLSARLRNAKDPTVLWSVSPKVGEITDDGTYTAPASLAGMVSVRVTAISHEDTRKSASLDLTLSPALAPSAVATNPPEEANPQQQLPLLKIVPASANISGGQARRFAVTPDPRGPVQWQISPSLGRIGPDGVYTAPATVSQDGNVTLTALSASGGSAGTALIHLKASVTPSGPRPENATVETIQATKNENGQTVLRALDHGGNPVAVRWSLSPEVGTISAEGVYTPPARVEVARDVTARASSQANPGNVSWYTVHLAPTYPAGVSVVVGPEEHATLRPGERKTFAATVKGTANTLVTWSAMGGGNIFPNGLYVAPPNVPQDGAHVRVRATSNANPSVYGEAEVMLRPSLAPVAARGGTFQWQGKLSKKQTLTIRNNVPSTGSLSGVLPTGPAEVHLEAGDCTMVVAPSAANNWSVLAVKAKSNQTALSFGWVALSPP